QKIHVYTFKLKCPYCASNTHELHRIRISGNNKIQQVIEKIEKVGDLNILNIEDFPNMIRGEEANGLMEVKKLLKAKTGGTCSFIYAKDDFQYYYYTKNKSFDLDKVDSTILKGQNFEYYTQPKLLIKHNTILPQAVYSEDILCFTSSIYSLLDDNIINLKYLCALINSSLIQFYCFYGINNQQNTTINLNQYMIRHLPLINMNNKEKLLISKKVDLIIEAFKTNKGQIDNTIAKIWRELDEGFFHMYSLSQEDKGIILNAIKGEIDFLKLIYSSEIK
ncbi:MAG: TaqI-like C-terminal specificity domain-containing protein, partial [Candidatus Hermodarchaeota archaeon]